MPIYAKPVRLLMKDMANDFSLKPGESFNRRRAIAWFTEHYPKIKPGTVTAHLTRLSTNAPSRLHYSASAEDDLFYQDDNGLFRLYDPKRDPLPIHAAAEVVEQNPQAASEDEAEEAREFAYEKDLKNYLAKNLGKIERGLRIYEEEGITGIEFPVGGRWIDILAVSAAGEFVVIELKVSKGYDRVVGQLMRYMAWIRKNLAEPNQSCAESSSQERSVKTSCSPALFSRVSSCSNTRCLWHSNPLRSKAQIRNIT
jgi:hypothetical protein